MKNGRLKQWFCAAVGVIIAAWLPFILLAFGTSVLVLVGNLWENELSEDAELLMLLCIIPTMLIFTLSTFVLGGFWASRWWMRCEFSWKRQQEFLLGASSFLIAPLLVIALFERNWEMFSQIFVYSCFGLPIHFSLTCWGASEANSKRFGAFRRYFLGQTPYKPGEEPTKNTRDD